MTWKYDLNSDVIRQFIDQIIQGKSLAEAAEVLGVTERTVSRKMKVDARLRRLVEQAIERRDKAKLLPCGTRSSYDRGCRCELCRAANAISHRGQRKRRKSYPDDRIPHGQYGYSNYGCRCDVCSESWRVKMLRERERRLGDSDHVPHGTQSGYKAWGCRCEDCSRARYAVDGPRKAAAYAETLDSAHHHGHQWTGPEMELALRQDLSARQAALMLGRTIHAVGAIRKRLKIDPRYIHAAGVVDPSEVP